MKNKYLHLIITFTFFIGIFNLQAAQYYWVGGSGDWSDFASHWATASGGSTFHTAVPTASDDVFFDSNSFSDAGQLVTSTANILCKDFIWTGASFAPSFQSDVDLTVYGDIVLNGDVTYRCFNVFLKGTSNIQITSNGASFGDGSGLKLWGTGYTFVDNLQCGSINLITGTLHTNNQKVTLEHSFGVVGDEIKELNLGNSNIYCGSWNMTSKNTTFNAGGSTIHTELIRSNQDGFSEMVYNNVSAIHSSILFKGSSKFNVIDLASVHVKSCRFEPGTTNTFQDILTDATKNDLISLSVDGDIGFATLKKVSGTLSIPNAIVRNIHAIGGASFVVNPGIDSGGNTGWTFTPFPNLEYYWVGNGGDWEDLSHWAKTSGGSVFYTTLPSPFDKVIFDEHSFNTAHPVVKINGNAKVKEISCRNLDGTSKLSAAYGKSIAVYGNVDLTGMIKEIYSLNIKGGGQSVDLKVGNLGSITSIDSDDFGTYNLLSDVDCGWFNFHKGTLNTNGFDLKSKYIVTFQGLPSNPTTVYMGDSKFFCKTFRILGTGVDFNAGTSQIRVTKDFIGAGHSFYHVILSEESLVQDDNTFDILECEPGSKNTISTGSTQTILSDLVINGTVQSPISIASSEAGSAYTFSKSTGIVNAKYLSISDNIATGGATFNAIKSIDNGNNIGWNIEGIVPHNYFWVGGSGNWSDVDHWAKTSGGTEKYIDPPGQLDDVFFDVNSFSATGQTVTLDVDEVYFNSMDWSNVTNQPSFSGDQKTLNIGGSLIYSDQMSSDITFYRFTGSGDNIFNPGFENSPGDGSHLYFNSEGSWSLEDDLVTWKIEFEGGTFNSNNHNITVVGVTYFGGFTQKTWNMGTSKLSLRALNWLDKGDNLTFDASNANFICSGGLVINPWQVDNVDFSFGNMHFVKFLNDVGKISGSISIDTLFIEAGKELHILDDNKVIVNMLVANGTEADPIIFKGSSVGVQAQIYKDGGEVQCDYLQLKDISALGSANFIANHSINQGNVTGWTFTNQSQTITFPNIDDVLEGFTGIIELTATASSGLAVNYEIISGQAELNGSQLSILGAGKVQIKASQSGNIEYNPATSVTQSFCVTPNKPEISVSTTPNGELLTSSSTTGNVWFLNENVIDGAINQTYLPTETGDYSVQIDLGGCQSEISDVKNIIITGIEDVFMDRVLKVTPNPVMDILTVNLPFLSAGNYRIINSLGLVVDSRNIEQKDVKLMVDTRNIKNGVYWIVVELKEGSYQSIFVKE